jgi:hypothetical protein
MLWNPGVGLIKAPRAETELAGLPAAQRCAEREGDGVALLVGRLDAVGTQPAGGDDKDLGRRVRQVIQGDNRPEIERQLDQAVGELVGLGEIELIEVAIAVVRNKDIVLENKRLDLT